jgi:signal transduction histidine kinase/DNA-binding response OmpR family regulator
VPSALPSSVLLVDDQPRNLIALEAALTSLDCHIVTAGSGRDALEYVLTQDFAVIVLDVHMPGVSGFETARLIRARDRSASTPIIFLTADNDIGAPVLDGYRLGAVDFIYKPFNADILRAKVAVFVELFRKTVALEQRTAELTQVTADLVLRERQVGALNAQLEDRVIERTAALEAAFSRLEAEAVERLRNEGTLRAMEHAARADAEQTAGRASALAEVSRVLVENFMDHGPMLGHVAQIAASATDSACVIQLIAEDGDDAGLVPLAVDYSDQAVRAELARALSVPHKVADSPWDDLDRVFLDVHPLKDALSVPMLARTAMIGVLSLGRFGSDAARFNNSERRLSNDLAARVALAVENARLYENARAAIELRDNFLTIAAHELKTPLTTIQGYSQLLSHQLKQGLGQDAVPVRRSARMIAERTRHLARLVEQILDVSRLGASRMQINKDDTDVAELMRNLVAGFESQNPAREFRLELVHEHLQATVDPMRLDQVMANLLDNAVRYSPDGGPIDITVQLAEQDAVELSVRDRGLGIPEEHRAHIFDRFHQAHTLAFRSGMGLGLHISREIVRLHGGKITVAFPADSGSLFTVRLPR